MECPGCNSETSTVLAEYSKGNPCPYCGLSASAISEIRAARRRAADADLTAKYEEAIKRADKAEKEAGELRWRLRKVEQALKAEAPAWNW